MVEQVVVQSDETTSEAPAVEEQVSKPEGLPEKFNSVEDMAKSYAELEAKLGQPKEEPKEEAKAEEQPKSDLEIQADEAVESAGLDMDSLSAEYAESGQLADESYERLEKVGISRDIVDQFIAGQEARALQQGSEVKSIVGGEAAYIEMTQWAGNNLSTAEVEAYNKAVNSGEMETIKLAVTGLQARYIAAEGSDPKLLSGKAGATSQGGYESWAQVQADMGDPRYAKDPAFQAEVQEKLANSNL
jgi:hypothetical protein